MPYGINHGDSYNCRAALFSAFTLIYDCRVRPGLFHAGVDETRRPPPLTPLRHIDADAPQQGLVPQLAQRFAPQTGKAHEAFAVEGA